MIITTFLALFMVALNVAVHALGLAILIRFTLRLPARPSGLWGLTWLVIRMTWAIILLHVISIFLWAALFYMSGHPADAETALYFSGATYTTIGYGDVVLSEPWRILCPIEGLNGILLCGLSTAFFFAVLTRVRSLPTPASTEEPGAPSPQSTTDTSQP